MIVARQKPIAEVAARIGDAENVLVAGCGGCVTVCLSGGHKEAEILAASLRIMRKKEGRPLATVVRTPERQCDKEYVDALAEWVAAADCVVSLACGVGVQYLAERYPYKLIVPAQDTQFAGGTTEHGVWEERCGLCGECILAATGGICPVARCAKSLLNGPCGGSQDGRCEVKSDNPCAWVLIYEQLKRQGREACLAEILPAKDWSRARDGGPRRYVREDALL